MTTETQNNLNDEFIPYEQALALKKLGFNNTCFKKSVHKKKCDNKDEKGNCPLHNIFCGYPDCEIDKTIKTIGMPTYSQAFKFFRKEHGLYSSIVPKKSTPDNFVSGVEWYVWIWGGNGKELGPKDTYSYPEAELACLNKLIELGRQDKQAKIIRAKTPAGYDQRIHVVTKFKRDNYSSFYELQEDGFYRYQEHSAEASTSYTEGALLALSNVEVVEFKNK